MNRPTDVKLCIAELESIRCRPCSKTDGCSVLKSGAVQTAPACAPSRQCRPALTVHNDSYASFQAVLGDRSPVISSTERRHSAALAAVEPLIVGGALGMVCSMLGDLRSEATPEEPAEQS